MVLQIGGLVLLPEARDAYFWLQGELTTTVHTLVHSRRRKKLDFDRREHLKALASGLRTQMATDVETRVGPRLRQSILSRLGQHRRVGRRRIRVTVRRGSPRDREKAECYVVTVVNLSSERDVELKRVGLPALLIPRLPIPFVRALSS